MWLVSACVGGQEPELTPELGAQLSGDAAVVACSTCTTGTVYVRDHLLKAQTRVGEEEPMPDLVRERLAEVFDEVVFVGMDEETEMLGDDLQPENGTVVYVGPVERLDANVLGIDIGLITKGDGFRGQTVQFLWDGDTWRLSTSEDTGVPVTTSVS